ncbi:MAG: prepilin-type N-terminal cleavage/methylation domain-containing protein [Verrucomicrobiota bacterium]
MSSSHQRVRGFSLIELMFSMAIGSIILILAATMLGSSGDGYERVGGSVASEREARALISQLASDLSTAKFQKDGVIEKSSESWPTDRLGFLSLQPSQAQTKEGHIGDLCAVTYYIKDLTMGGKNVRCLMRGFRESKDTFDALRNDSVAGLFDPSGAKADLDEPVAFGVVAFEARPRSRDAAGNWIDWVKNDITGPDSLEVKLVIARRDLVGRLKKPEDWNGAGKLLGEASKADRNKDLEIYATTIRFGNHAK